MQREAESYFRHLDARILRGELDASIELFQQYCKVAIASTHEAGYAELFDVFSLVGESPLVPCLDSALGGEPFIPFQYCLVRRVFATQIREAAPFHQDISPIGPDVPISCWVPLSECGADAPGLEFVARAMSDRLARTKANSHHGSEIDEEVVVSDFGRHLWHPELRPGDVIVFNNLTIHRSFLIEGMTKPRYSIEFRGRPFFDRRARAPVGRPGRGVQKDAAGFVKRLRATGQ